MITDTGKIIRIRVDLESLRTIGRSTQGVKLQDLGADGNRILAIAPVLERETSDEDELEGDDIDDSDLEEEDFDEENGDEEEGNLEGDDEVI